MKAVVGLRLSFSSHVRFGERGAPVFPFECFGRSEVLGQLPLNDFRNAATIAGPRCAALVRIVYLPFRQEMRDRRCKTGKLGDGKFTLEYGDRLSTRGPVKLSAIPEFFPRDLHSRSYLMNRVRK